MDLVMKDGADELSLHLFMESVVEYDIPKK